MTEKPHRLAVHIPAEVGRRLRLLSAASGQQQGQIVAEALDKELPTTEALGARIAGKDTADVS